MVFIEAFVLWLAGFESPSHKRFADQFRLDQK